MRLQIDGIIYRDRPAEAIDLFANPRKKLRLNLRAEGDVIGIGSQQVGILPRIKRPGAPVEPVPVFNKPVPLSNPRAIQRIVLRILRKKTMRGMYFAYSV